jgi:hypothetical protein
MTENLTNHKALLAPMLGALQISVNECAFYASCWQCVVDVHAFTWWILRAISSACFKSADRMRGNAGIDRRPTPSALFMEPQILRAGRRCQNERSRLTAENVLRSAEKIAPMDQLERQQRQRRGEDVPPPLNINVGKEGDDAFYQTKPRGILFQSTIV